MFSWEQVVSSRPAFVEKGQRVVAETENLQIGVPLMRLPHTWSWALLAHDDNPHFPALRPGPAQRLFQEPPAKSNFLAVSTLPKPPASAFSEDKDLHGIWAL